MWCLGPWLRECLAEQGCGWDLGPGGAAAAAGCLCLTPCSHGSELKESPSPVRPLSVTWPLPGAVTCSASEERWCRTALLAPGVAQDAHWRSLPTQSIPGCCEAAPCCQGAVELVTSSQQQSQWQCKQHPGGRCICLGLKPFGLLPFPSAAFPREAQDLHLPQQHSQPVLLALAVPLV